MRLHRSQIFKMSTTKYDEDFKKSLVTLYQNGKTQAQLCREYGVSESTLCKWVKQYATVQTDDGVVLTTKQVKKLQKRNAQLREENLILPELGIIRGKLDLLWGSGWDT